MFTRLQTTSASARRATAIAACLVLAATLSACSDDDPKDQSTVSESPSATASDDATEKESDDPSEEPTDEKSDEAEDFDPVPRDELETSVAGIMDKETGTTFPVECDGDLENVLDATQRCWRLIDGYADQGVPDGSKLGLTVSVTEARENGPEIWVQADDEITTP